MIDLHGILFFEVQGNVLNGILKNVTKKETHFCDYSRFRNFTKIFSRKTFSKGKINAIVSLRLNGFDTIF